MKNLISNDRILELCKENHWFLSCLNGQIIKLFELNDSGADICSLATMIWLCSDCDRSSILEILCFESLPSISTGRLVDSLRSGGFGELEVEQISLAVSNSPQNGVSYRVI